MIYGYVNPYSRDETGWIQRKMLENYGVDELFEEGKFGTEVTQEQRSKLMEKVKPNDQIVVIKLSCFASTNKILIENLKKLIENRVRFISLFDQIDTKSNGPLYVNTLQRMDEFGFDIRSERTRLGIFKNKKKKL